MMIVAYSPYAAPLAHDTLFPHGILLSHDRSIEFIGPTVDMTTRCRSCPIVSPNHGAFRSHALRAGPGCFEDVRRLFQPHGARRAHATGRADARGTSALLVRKHPPFEDRNGRLRRALFEKSLAQNIGHPSLITLAYTIERDRKGYYVDLCHRDWLLSRSRRDRNHRCVSRCKMGHTVNAALPLSGRGRNPQWFADPITAGKGPSDLTKLSDPARTKLGQVNETGFC